MNKDIIPAVGRNHNIDILKVICALEVVFVHVSCLANTFYPHYSVPGFFMISGFFFYSADQNKRSEKLVRAIKHIAILILWSNAIYFAYHLVHCWQTHRSFSTLLTLDNFINTIVWNDNSWAVQLWYLNAYTYALVVIYFLNKWGLFRVLFWITPLCLLFNLATKYSTCLFGVMIPGLWSRNFIGFGIPFFTIGMLVRQYLVTLQSCRWLVKGAPWFVALFVLLWPVERYVWERFNIQTQGDLYLTSLFLSLSLFFTFTLRSCKSENWLSRIGRDDSLYIYIFHMLVAWIFMAGLNIIGLGSLMPIYHKIAPFIIFPLTLLLIHLSRYAWRLCCKAKNGLAVRKSIK